MIAVVAPDEVWGAWLADPLAAVAILAGAFLYLRGVERLWRRAGRGSVVAGWQVGAYLAGLGALAVALLSPLEGLAGTLLTAHMAQHLVLTLLAAPLLALGAPSLPSIWGAPAALRPRLHRWRLPAAWRARLASPGMAIVAALAHIGVLWLWHVPTLYEAAVRSTAVHVVEHAMMLGTAVWLWWALIGSTGPRRRASPVSALAMFLLATLTVGIGVLLTFSPHTVYPVYLPGAEAWGLTALEDQQQAGAMMWSISGIVYMAAGAATFGVWLARAQRDSDGPEGRDGSGDVKGGPTGGTARVIADTTAVQ
jgi:putative membrane protein